MAKRRPEGTAAELLKTWTDSDTAMQIVGTSIGVFGAGLLDPEIVLAKETPLRNALFDVLLSLVEGGALDVRPTDDGHYAFRWRADYAVGALTPEMVTTIDIDVPSPYLTELAEARRQRDEALERAESAEALAASARESAAPDASRPDAPAPFADEEDEEDYEDEGEEYEAAEFVDVEAPATEGVIDLVTLESESESAEVVYLTPAAPTSVAAEADERGDVPEPDVAGRSKWRPYTLDKPRSHLSSVERFANQG